MPTPNPKTLYSNYLLVEHEDRKGHVHRERWRLDFRAILTEEKIQVHPKGSLTGSKDRTYRYRVIVVDYHMTREDFIKTMKRHFSLEWSVKPREVTLELENYLALWGRTKQ